MRNKKQLWTIAMIVLFIFVISTVLAQEAKVDKDLFGEEELETKEDILSKYKAVVEESVRVAKQHSDNTLIDKLIEDLERENKIMNQDWLKETIDKLNEYKEKNFDESGSKIEEKGIGETVKKAGIGTVVAILALGLAIGRLRGKRAGRAANNMIKSLEKRKEIVTKLGALLEQKAKQLKVLKENARNEPNEPLTPENQQEVNKSLTEINKINRSVVGKGDTLLKETADMREKLGAVKVEETKTEEKTEKLVKEAEKRVAQHKEMEIEELEKKIMQLVHDEKSADELITHFAQYLDKHGKVIKGLKKLIMRENGQEENSDKLNENNSITKNAEYAAKQIQNINEWVTHYELFSKTLKEFLDSEFKVYETIKKGETSIISPLQHLKAITVKVDKELKTVKKESKEMVSNADELKKLETEEMEPKKLEEILKNLLTLVKNQNPAKIKELYNGINRMFAEKATKIVLKYKGLTIRFRIKVLAANELLLAQLNKEEKDVKDIRVKIIKLEEQLQHLIDRERENEAARIMRHPESARAIAERAVNVLGIMTKDDIENIAREMVHPKAATYSRKLNIKVFKSIYRQRGEKGGLRGLGNYVHNTLKDLHEEIEKNRDETKVWNALADLYNKAVSEAWNYTQEVSSNKFSEKEFHDVFIREVPMEMKKLAKAAV